MRVLFAYLDSHMDLSSSYGDSYGMYPRSRQRKKTESQSKEQHTSWSPCIEIKSKWRLLVNFHPRTSDISLRLLATCVQNMTSIISEYDLD